ncbi:hypothetical protein TCAL_10764 [Tigriopus californicus]|uniref:G-protein coupled receptors family 1 profile domain-containing protein n=1 Tax=Tigriopus californicus TaxID=6832 RepID=A0A553PP15_TIGCA|nr:hypothetical protein TCAL_10764 [Tigriopus californicus]|eukprot:TCALIF_10764-PA protein Name:"Similar to Gabrb1 Gamma-aminobutyric acid receptor subunit beta-1 (Rattus norvegicus)" AED:0.32 eAED:0.32 QI:0/0.5/0/0.66/1/1/3/0/928
MTAVDRYQAICHPLTNQVWASKKSKFMIFLAWIISLVLCIPQAIIFHSPKPYICTATFAPNWGMKVDVKVKEISLCFAFNFYYIRNQDILQSQVDLRLVFKEDGNAGLIAIKGGSRLIELPTFFQDEWNSLCMSVDLTGNAVMFVNGLKTFSNKISRDLSVLEPAFSPNFMEKLIIGFANRSDVFRGEMTQFNIWSTVLDEQEMRLFTDSFQMPTPNPDLLNWKRATFATGALVRSTKYPLSSIQRKAYPQYNIYQSYSNLEQATGTCKKYGGVLAKPETHEDHIKIFRAVQARQDRCPEYVIPFRKSEANTIVQLDSLDAIAFLNWDEGQPNGGTDQTALVVTESGNVKDVEPSYSACFVCKFERQVEFRLMGMPSELGRYIDRVYSYNHVMERFKGKKFGNFIALNPNESQWEIFSCEAGKAHYILEHADSPIGLRDWENAQGTGKSVDATTALKMTVCLQGQFTCSSGYCVDIGQLCDGWFDCDDTSDEKECNPLYGGNVGVFKRPPVTQAKGQKVSVFIQAEILKILEIAELEEVFKVKILLQLRWRDPRLLYANLKNITFSNKIFDPRQIWTPRIIFENTDTNKEIMEEEFSLFVEQLTSEGQNSHLSATREALVFNGSENNILMAATLAQEFHCEYTLNNFPFDVQRCSIRIAVAKELSDFVELIPNFGTNLEYLANRDLIQFRVTDEVMTLTSGGDVVITITLKRNFHYHLATTYLPSTCLVLAALMVLFIDQKHFEVTLMVALTSMLVMYTLYQGVSNSLPKTAYLKLIDIWLIFGLIMPFAVFLVLVVWELLSYERNSSVVSFKGIPVITHNVFKAATVAYVTWFSISSFFVPLLALVFCYAQICRAIWNNFSANKAPTITLPAPPMEHVPRARTATGSGTDCSTRHASEFMVSGTSFIQQDDEEPSANIGVSKEKESK